MHFNTVIVTDVDVTKVICFWPIFYFILFNVVWPGIIKQTLFNWLMVHVVKNHVVTGYHQPWGYKVFILMFIIYLSLSSGDLTNTSSQICGSWYLPMFLLRDGSLTLISMASLMVLAMLWSSLPTMLKLSRDTSWPVMLKWSCIGDGALMCSLNLSANVLPDFPIYSSSKSTLPHLCL